MSTTVVNEGLTHTTQFNWSFLGEREIDGLGPFQVWETDCKAYKVCRCDGADRRFIAIRNRLGEISDKIVGNDLHSLYDAFLSVEKDFFERNGIAMESNVLDVMKKAKELGLHKLKREEKPEVKEPVPSESPNDPVEVKEKRKRGRKGTGMNGMSGLDACIHVLSKSEKPMSNIEILGELTKQGLWTSQAKSPADVLKAIMMNDIRKGDKSRIKKVSRGMFSVK